MRYQGGKEMVARQLASAVVGLGMWHGCERYLEPFLGGASIASRVVPHYPDSLLADAWAPIVHMWEQAATGWDPPTHCTEWQYRTAANLPDTDPRKAFYMHGCSFNGVRSTTSYAVSLKGGDKKFILEARRGLLKKARGLRGAQFVVGDYASHNVTPGTLVYCDPPYQGTSPYGVQEWDPERFWATVAHWSRQGAVVLVSEQTAPSGWRVEWQRPKRVSIGAFTQYRARLERLWIHDSIPL